MAEHLIVVQAVEGSSPFIHPKFCPQQLRHKHRGKRARAAAYVCVRKAGFRRRAQRRQPEMPLRDSFAAGGG